MADSKSVPGKQKSCPVRTALHTIRGPVVMDPVSYAVLPGKQKIVILGSPTLATVGIKVYDSLGECARKRNPSVQCVASLNFEDSQLISFLGLQEKLVVGSSPSLGWFFRKTLETLDTLV